MDEPEVGNGQPAMVARENAPHPAAQVRGSLADMKATVGYGGMHFCRYGDCEVWVADGGDHRCVLHSTEPYAVELRTALAARLAGGLVEVGMSRAPKGVDTIGGGSPDEAVRLLASTLSRLLAEVA